MPDYDIKARHRRCNKFFNDFADMLDAHQEMYSSQVAISALLDELGRFRIWASNAGLSVADDRPADVSLPTDPHTSAALDRILSDLETSLQAGISIVSGARLPADELGDGSDMQEPHARTEMVLELEDEVGIADGANGSSGNCSSPTELQELFRAIVDSTTSLLRLSAIARNAKAAAVSDDDFPAVPLQSWDDVDQNDESENYPFIRDKPWLVRRLRHASAARRHRLSGERSNRLSAARHLAVPDESGVEGTAGLAQAAPASATLEAHSGGAEQSTGDMALERLAITWSPSTSDVGLNASKLPRGVEYGRPFECPCCLDTIIVKDAASWKAHLVSSLRPYICTFNGCTTKQYSSRSDWFQHELRFHRRVWKCQICGRRDTSRPNFGDHLRCHEESLTDDQLSVFAEMWEGPEEHFSLAECPLCGGGAGRDSASLASPGQGEAGASEQLSARQFEAHLGRHLEELAWLDRPRRAVPEDETGPASSQTPRGPPVQSSPAVEDALIRKVREPQPLAAGTAETPSELYKCCLSLVQGHNHRLQQDDLKQAALLAMRALNALPEGHINYEGYLVTLDGILRKLGAMLRDFGCVVPLLSKGNAAGLGTRALHAGARLGAGGLVGYLVAAGVNDTHINTGQTNSLHMAVIYQQLPMVRLLLAAGADALAVDEAGWTALHLACAQGSVGLARGLLDAVVAAQTPGSTVARCLAATTADTGATALHCAVDAGKTHVAEMLLERGADIESRDANGRTVFQHAVASKNPALRGLLLKHGASAIIPIEGDKDHKGKEKRNVRTEAVHGAEIEAVSMTSASGNPRKRTEDDYTGVEAVFETTAMKKPSSDLWWRCRRCGSGMFNYDLVSKCMICKQSRDKGILYG